MSQIQPLVKGPEGEEVDHTGRIRGGGGLAYYPDEYEEPGSDRIRMDLSAKLRRIGPLDAVRFVFNDTVDRRTFRVKYEAVRDGDNTLSITYADDRAGSSRAEVQATASRRHWVESRAGTIVGYGQYVWEDSRTLLIGPPEGGWLQGRYVFFEFDEDLSDDAGNKLKGGRDQVVIARVRHDIRCTILRPSESDTFIPWRSGDEIFGRLEDFTLTVVGRIVQHGGSQYPQKVIVTATSNKGLVITEEIACGDIDRRELHRGGTSDWIRDRQFGGMWAVRLRLQSSAWREQGCQAVVEGHHTWSISATVVAATGVRIKAVSRKVVRFELYQSRVLFVFCPQLRINSGILYHWKLGKHRISKCYFGRKDLGLKQFILVLDGEFDFETGITYINTYLGEEARQEVLYWERRWSIELKRWVTWVYLPGFHVHNLVRDIVVRGKFRNRMTHTFSIKIKTVAGLVIRFSFPFIVDTLPLDLVDATAVNARLLRGRRVDMEGEVLTGGGFYLDYGSAEGGRVFVTYSEHEEELILGDVDTEEIFIGDIDEDLEIATPWDDLLVVHGSSQEIEITETFESETEIDVEISEIIEGYGGRVVLTGGGFWGGMGLEPGIIPTIPELSDMPLPEDEPAWEEPCAEAGEIVEVKGTVETEMYSIGGSGMAARLVLVESDGRAWPLAGFDLDQLESGQVVAVRGVVTADCAIEVEDLELIEDKPTRRRKR